MKELPNGVSITKLRKNAVKYVASLDRIQAIALARHLDYLYHTLDKPIVDDEVYDILKDSIADRWPKAKYLKRIGNPVEKKKGVVEVKLPAYMPSMDKIKPGSKALEKFIETGSTYVIGDKLDGISLEILYEDGVPVGAYTRGDGVTGQDVSGVIPALDIPKRIPIKGVFIARLEFIIPNKTFDAKFSKHKGTGEFKTARNLGGGLLKRNEPSPAVRAYRCVSYNILKGKGYDQPLSKQLSLLKKYGFRVVSHIKINKPLTADVLVKLHNLRKKKSPYEIDGIIVTKDVGAKPSRKNPSHAKAFKINSIENSQVVPVTEVEWRVSRYGKIVPRIHIDPIIIDGVEVRHFTGHNAFYILNGFIYQDRAKGLPVRPIGKGAMIRVVRSGGVIPYIMEVVRPSRRPDMPKIPYTMDANGVYALAETIKGEDTVAIKKLVHFFSTMEIDGIKAGVLTKLKAAGFDTIKKIIDASVTDILTVDGFQEKSAKSLVSNIKSGLESATFAKTATASGLFGEKIAAEKLQKLVDYYPNIMQLASLPHEELTLRIAEVRGYAKLSGQVAAGLPKFAKFLARHGITLQKDSVPTGNRLAGLSVLFTSVRDGELAKSIKDQGGKIANSVKQANALIVKEGASNNKIDKAIADGTPVYTVDQFKKKYKLKD